MVNQIGKLVVFVWEASREITVLPASRTVGVEPKSQVRVANVSRRRDLAIQVVLMRERMRASVMNPIKLPVTIDATIQTAAVSRGSAMKPTRGFAASTPAKRGSVQ